MVVHLQKVYIFLDGGPPPQSIHIFDGGPPPQSILLIGSPPKRIIFFCREREEGGSNELEWLLDNCCVVIVPMLNPDGVVNGSSRCSLAGVDLNRSWDAPHPRLHPTIWALRSRIAESQRAAGGALLLLDMHAHSRAEGAFLYAAGASSVRRDPAVTAALRLTGLDAGGKADTVEIDSGSESEDDTGETRAVRRMPASTLLRDSPHGRRSEPETATVVAPAWIARLGASQEAHSALASLVAKHDSERVATHGSAAAKRWFRLAGCTDTVPPSKRTTARAVARSALGVALAYTLEISLAGTQGWHFSTQDLGAIGRDVAHSAASWIHALASPRMRQEHERYAAESRMPTSEPHTTSQNQPSLQVSQHHSPTAGSPSTLPTRTSSTKPSQTLSPKSPKKPPKPATSPIRGTLSPKLLSPGLWPKASITPSFPDRLRKAQHSVRRRGHIRAAQAWAGGAALLEEAPGFFPDAKSLADLAHIAPLGTAVRGGPLQTAFRRASELAEQLSTATPTDPTKTHQTPPPPLSSTPKPSKAKRSNPQRPPSSRPPSSATSLRSSASSSSSSRQRLPLPRPSATRSTPSGPRRPTSKPPLSNSRRIHKPPRPSPQQQQQQPTLQVFSFPSPELSLSKSSSASSLARRKH